MTQGIRIRLAEERDAETLTEFNVAMARETESRELSPATVASGVRTLLRRPETGFYVVAEKDGRVVGSLMTTREWSDWRNGFYWWIQSVYVRPGSRRQGVYRRLCQFLKDRAAQIGEVVGFRLYVERDNTIARKTYEALGMRETRYIVYEEDTRAG